MATTTLTFPPTPGFTTGYGPARPATNTNLSTAAIQNAPPYHQQASIPLSNLAASTSTTPSVSRPTSPSPTSTSHAVVPPLPQPTSPPNPSSASSYAVPQAGWSPPRVIATAIRHCIKGGKEVAVWVAIAFTIASFVRDYLNITKDSGPSAQERWQNYINFRSSCEDDRRRGQRSDACDLELSEPTKPPPGLFKRTLPGEEVQPGFALMDYFSQCTVTLIILAIMVVVSIVQKRFSKSHDETPDLHLVEQPSSSPNKSQPRSLDGPKGHRAKRISSSTDGHNEAQPCPSRHPRFYSAGRALISTGAQFLTWRELIMHLSVIAFFAYRCSDSFIQANLEMNRFYCLDGVLSGLGIITFVFGLLLGAAKWLSTTQHVDSPNFRLQRQQ